MEINLNNSDGNEINQSKIERDLEAEKYQYAMDNLLLDVGKFSDIIDGIYEIIKDVSDQSDPFEFQAPARDINGKNENNKLSPEFFEEIIVPNASDFVDIKFFLSQKDNRDLLQKYKIIISILQPSILDALNSGGTMDAILSKLSNYISNKTENSNDTYNYICALHYMYYICDLGKK